MRSASISRILEPSPQGLISSNITSTFQKFCNHYQPDAWFLDQFQNMYNFLSLPFVFIKIMTHKQVYTFTIINNRVSKYSSFYFLVCFHLQHILNSIFMSTLYLPLLVTGSIPCKYIIPLSCSCYVCKIVAF